jgi:DNA-binding NarL/FixJ family response regulator
MLLGREPERLALDRLLGEARAGRSGVLAFVGEPGIGKTALLSYASDQAAGMQILRVHPVESEAEVPFGGLRDVLRPALAALERIPAPQADALAGALALRPARAQDRFAVGVATLSLLAAHAEEGPILVLVDDAHWLDRSSEEALLFAFRRLVAEAIAVVITVREDEASLLRRADLRMLHLGGLDRAAAAALLASDSLPAFVVDRLYDATGGNPLALLELARDPHAVASLPPGAPLRVSRAIAEAFLRRAGALDAQTRSMLLLAAASDTGDLRSVAGAAATLGLDLAALGPAEAAGLIHLQNDRVEFRHPLARSAVYADASGHARREVHRALAQALADDDVDTRAWHLAAAALGPDEDAASALEHAARRARNRSAYAVAAVAFERASRLATGSEQTAALLLDAADSAWLGGLPDQARALLGEARDRTKDPALLVRLDHLRGRIATRCGPIRDGVDLLMAAATRASERDPDRAVVMLAEAAHACVYAGDTPALRKAARQANRVLRRDADERVRFFAALTHGMARITDGAGEDGARALRHAVELAESSPELRDDPRFLALLTQVPLWLREAESGRELIASSLELARRHAAIGVLPYVLNHLGRDQSMTDRWAEAEATFHEAIQLARDTGQHTELAVGLASLAWLEARQGNEHECRTHADEARVACRQLGIAMYDIWTMAAVGELELSLGRPEAAVAQFEAQTAALRDLGFADVDISPGPELVECYLRLGRPGRATATAEDYAAKATAKGQPWALARAARCRALVAADGGSDQHFEDALMLHARTPDLFEVARTRLAYGSRLRRARQRVRAREQLRAAISLFDELGARIWAEMAAAELAATGEKPRRRNAGTLDHLTPRERQIALVIAQGSTIREAAGGLFLSPKTVEYHLRHIYQKLGIRSRQDLTLAISADLGQPPDEIGASP